MRFTYTNIVLSEYCEVNMKWLSQNQHKSPETLKFEQKINNDRAAQKGYNQNSADATAGQGEAGRSSAAGMSQQKRAAIAALSC